MVNRTNSTTYAEAAVLGALLKHKTKARTKDCGVWAYRLGREAPGVSYSAAHRILKELQESGYVRVKEEPVGKRRRIKYILTPEGEEYAVEAITRYLDRIGVERKSKRHSASKKKLATSTAS